jgi:hypothetical protein
MAPACQELAPGAELETLTVNGSSREKSKSGRLVFSTGGAGVQPPRAYFNLDWSVKRVSRFKSRRVLAPTIVPKQSTRRFPPPWTVEQIPGGFKVLDARIFF